MAEDKRHKTPNGRTPYYFIERRLKELGKTIKEAATQAEMSSSFWSHNSLYGCGDMKVFEAMAAALELDETGKAEFRQLAIAPSLLRENHPDLESMFTALLFHHHTKKHVIAEALDMKVLTMSRALHEGDTALAGRIADVLQLGEKDRAQFIRLTDEAPKRHPVHTDAASESKPEPESAEVAKEVPTTIISPLGPPVPLLKTTNLYDAVTAMLTQRGSTRVDLAIRMDVSGDRLHHLLNKGSNDAKFLQQLVDTLQCSDEESQHLVKVAQEKRGHFYS